METDPKSLATITNLMKVSEYIVKFAMTSAQENGWFLAWLVYDTLSMTV